MRQNSLVTEQEILTADDIFGPDIVALKGKTFHKKS